MTSRQSVYALVLALALIGTLAEAQNLGVGTFQPALPTDASVGALRGDVPADAQVGGLAGSYGPNTSTYAFPGLSGSSGAFAGSLEPNAPLAGLRGSVPADAPVGTLTPAMPNASFGPPTPADIARRNEALGEIYLMDRTNPLADSALDRSTAIHEQSLGPKDLGMADVLESQARLLEKYSQNQARPGVDERNRDDKAAELQERAKKIRKEAERPAPKR